MPTGPAKIVAYHATFKTYIVRFVLSTPSITRTYVAKIARETPTDDWDPSKEYDAFLVLNDLSRTSSHWGVPRPVGSGVDPRFLVTRYAAGSVMRALAEPGMRHFANQKRSTVSRFLCSQAGRALIGMRQATARNNPAAEAQPERFLSFCDARLCEIDRWYHRRYTRGLRGGIGTQLERLIATGWAPSSGLFSRTYGCHGDFSLQNLLVEEGQPPILLDLEGFRITPWNDDYATFRFRLEHLHLNPRFSARRLTACWTAFHELFVNGDSLELYATASYLRKLLAHVAWLRNPARRRMDPRRTRIRNWLWARGRLRWLGRFAKQDSVAHLHDTIRYVL